MYTKKQLQERSFTKDKLVDEVLTLQKKLDSPNQETTGTGEKIAETLTERISGIAIQLGEDPDEFIEKLNADNGREFRLQEIGEETVPPTDPATPLTLSTVVIPYKASAAAGEELRYALRSWEINYPGLQKIVIIGDDPGITSSTLDRLVWIPHTPVSDNPQIDVAHKMMVAIASDQVPDEFIWSNDDIYLTNQVTDHDLRLLTANGELKDSGDNRIYNQNRKRTIAALKDNGHSFYNYATHTPKVFFKSRLAHVLTQFNCENEGHLISSLYFNFENKATPFIVDNGPKGQGYFVVSVWKLGISDAGLANYADYRRFLNHNDKGWPVCQRYLESRFPSPSTFEV